MTDVGEIGEVGEVGEELAGEVESVGIEIGGGLLEEEEEEEAVLPCWSSDPVLIRLSCF